MALPSMRPVFSSHIDSIGYDEEAGELHVAFQTGRTAVYSEVPPNVARDILTAPSIGQALHRQIRGQKPFG